MNIFYYYEIIKYNIYIYYILLFIYKIKQIYFARYYPKKGIKNNFLRENSIDTKTSFHFIFPLLSHNAFKNNLFPILLRYSWHTVQV